MIATATKPRWVLICPELAPKVVDDSKTQTRRVIVPQPNNPFCHGTSPIWGGGGPMPEQIDKQRRFGIHAATNVNGQRVDRHIMCPYGAPGDKIVFLTTWSAPKKYDRRKPSRLPKDVPIWSYFDRTPKPENFGRYRPGRFMPLRLRSRLPQYEITAIRAEQLQSISAADLLAEGLTQKSDPEFLVGTQELFSHFVLRKTWDRLNAGRGYSFSSNPWVWVVTFRRLTYSVMRHMHELGADKLNEPVREINPVKP